MKRALIALAALAAPAAPLAAQGLAPVGPRLTTYLPSESSPLVALRVIVQAGSQNDPKGKEGLAALTASLIAQGGTEDLTYEQILQKFYPMAAGLGSDCLKEVTVFSGTIHRDNLAEYEKLVARMLTAPRFAPEDFERLRNEQLDYLTTVLRGGNDEELGKQALQLMIYPPDHPYGHVDEGTVAGLKAITLDDVKAFHRAHYGQATVRLGVAGGADEAFVKSFRADLDALPEGAGDVPDLPKVAPPSGLEVTIVEKPADATAISIGFPIDVTRRDDDFYALAVANSYLGEHRTFNGRLQIRLRSARGLNYGNYAYIEDFLQEGGSNLPIPNNPRRQQYFSIWIRPVAPDRAPFALRAALFELDKLVDEGMSEEDFEATRDFLLNYSNLWVQTLSRRLGYAMEGGAYDRESLVAEMQRRLPTLTVEQVNAAVRKHLKPKGMYVAMVAQDADALKQRLASGEPTPMTYDTAGTPEDILAEDRTIERFPLGDVSVKVVPAGGMFEK
jgi:zinc protease